MKHASDEERNAAFSTLVSVLQSASNERFDPFDISSAHYQSSGHQIGLKILIPKSFVSRKPRPVIVRIHGGFLITGSTLFPAWFSEWFLDFAVEYGAVIISPDYRLLPEVKGVDILRDFAAFWEWLDGGGVERHLAAVGRDDIALDRSQLLLAGESAGGYLAIQSVLSGFVRPKAMIALYPMLDMKSDHYTKEFEKPIVGVPNFPGKVIDDFLANSSAPITEADPPERLDLAFAAVQTGRYLEFLGTEPELFVLDRIRAGNSAARKAGEPLLPPIFIMHGAQDTAVPADGTHKFAKLLDEVEPETKYHMEFRPGEHGFDFSTKINENWLREGLNHITKVWLQGGKDS